jgi:LacI family transcriptional regulator
MKGGMRALLELLSVRQRPTGVLCSNDMTAIGLMREAFDYGIRVPEDLSVVGFDDIRLAQFLIPPLTTVQMSQTELANLAFKALLNHVESDSSSLKHTEYDLHTTLVVRKSTGLAPSSVVTEKSIKSRRLVTRTAKLSKTSSG